MDGLGGSQALPALGALILSLPLISILAFAEDD